MVGFLASIAAVVFGWIPDGHFSIGHAILLCASSVATAFIASLVLGKKAILWRWAGRGESLRSLYCCCNKTKLPPPGPLGMIMIGVIIGSRKMGINPDNVATPIAASLGDLITLALLSGISWGLYIELGKIKEVAWPSSLHCIL